MTGEREPVYAKVNKKKRQGIIIVYDTLPRPRPLDISLDTSGCKGGKENFFDSFDDDNIEEDPYSTIDFENNNIIISPVKNDFKLNAANEDDVDYPAPFTLPPKKSQLNKSPGAPHFPTLNELHKESTPVRHERIISPDMAMFKRSYEARKQDKVQNLEIKRNSPARRALFQHNGKSPAKTPPIPRVPPPPPPHRKQQLVMTGKIYSFSLLGLILLLFSMNIIRKLMNLCQKAGNFCSLTSLINHEAV